MTALYNEVIEEAQTIANLPPVSADFTRRWNALEDRLLGKVSLNDLAWIEKFAREEAWRIMGAGVILTIIEDGFASQAAQLY
jgi:hypothetical protein